MSGFINLYIEVITQHIGQQIEYYELWNASQESFRRGRSFIHGIFKDKTGVTRIYSDTVWGTGLEHAILVDPDGFCFAHQSHIYLAPAPFQIYKISWINGSFDQESRFVPVESDIEIHLAARRFTDGYYRSVRVNLDGSVYKI